MSRRVLSRFDPSARPAAAPSPAEAPRDPVADSLVDFIRRQLRFLRDSDYGYQSLHLYLAGQSSPWELGPLDELEFHDRSGLLIVRDGPSGADGYGNIEVPEYVFRIDSIVATQLV